MPRGRKCRGIAARAQHRGKLGHGLAAHRGYRDGKLGGFALDRVAPMVVVVAHLQQPVARAQGAIQRRHPAGMLGVDRQHQPVEKPPPFRCGPHEQPVHRRCQPHHAQMIAEGGGGTHRLAVDPAAPAGSGFLRNRRIDAGAERRQSQRAFDLGGHRPRAVALDYRRHRRAWRGASPVPATETRSPRCNWSCRRRSAPPAPPHPRASARLAAR